MPCRNEDFFSNLGFEHLDEDIASEIIQSLARLGYTKRNFKAVETKYIVLYSLPFIYPAFFKPLHNHSWVFPFDYDFPTLKGLDSSVEFHHCLVFCQPQLSPLFSSQHSKTKLWL